MRNITNYFAEYSQYFDQNNSSFSAPYEDLEEEKQDLYNKNKFESETTENFFQEKFLKSDITTVLGNRNASFKNSQSQSTVDSLKNYNTKELKSQHKSKSDTHFDDQVIEEKKDDDQGFKEVGKKAKFKNSSRNTSLTEEDLKKYCPLLHNKIFFTSTYDRTIIQDYRKLVKIPTEPKNGSNTRYYSILSVLREIVPEKNGGTIPDYNIRKGYMVKFLEVVNMGWVKKIESEEGVKDLYWDSQLFYHDYILDVSGVLRNL